MTGEEPQRAPEFRVGWQGAVRRPGGPHRAKVTRITPRDLEVQTCASRETMTFYDAGGRWTRYGHPDTYFGKMSDREWSRLR